MAQESTPPATRAEREALYTQILDDRVDGIMEELALTDTNKADRVRTILLLQYRSLRLRDQVMDAHFEAEGQDPTDFAVRADLRRELSAPLRQWFVGVLQIDLTPDQVVVIKDAMTYGKLEHTYNSYCEIVPNLTDADKAKIRERLKAARDEAIEGGSEPEKSAIFQVYKDQIDAYLDAHGHNVAQAIKDWEAKHPAEGQMAAGE